MSPQTRGARAIPHQRQGRRGHVWDRPGWIRRDPRCSQKHKSPEHPPRGLCFPLVISILPRRLKLCICPFCSATLTDSEGAAISQRLNDWIGHASIGNTVIYAQLTSHRRDEEPRKVFASQ